MTEEKIHKDRPGNWWALSPLLVFLCLYLVTSILVNDFYKVPITVAFLVSSCYAIAITRGLKLDQRIYQFSVGAANKNILLMIWIFILAGAFAQSSGKDEYPYHQEDIHPCRSFCPKRKANGCNRCHRQSDAAYSS